MPHKRATDAVFRNLQKDDPNRAFRHVYESLQYTSLADFTKSAKGWLSDRSELGSWSLDNCDWQEVYEYFKKWTDQ